MKQLKNTALFLAGTILSACGSDFKSLSPNLVSNQTTTQATGNSTPTPSPVPNPFPTPTPTPTPVPTPTPISLNPDQIQSVLSFLNSDLQKFFQALEGFYLPGTMDVAASTISYSDSLPCPSGGSISIGFSASYSSTDSTSESTWTLSGPMAPSSVAFANCSAGGLTVNGSLSILSVSQDLVDVYVPNAGDETDQVDIQAVGTLGFTSDGNTLPCPASLTITETASYTAQYTQSGYHENGSGTVQLSGSVCGLNASEQTPFPISQ